jgi:hypothetical protein
MENQAPPIDVQTLAIRKEFQQRRYEDKNESKISM